MGRARETEFKNTYVEERVKVLLPEFERLIVFSEGKSTFKDKNDKKRKGKTQLRKDGDAQNGIYGWKSLAVREAGILKANYRNPSLSEDEQTYSTCLRQIPDLIKGLKDAAKNQLLDDANYHPVLTVIEHFRGALTFLFSEYRAASNEVYRNRVQERSKSDVQLVIDPTQYLQKAFDTLTIAANGGTNLKDVEWRDVSCALALVTGRRMAEVHLSADFEQVSDYEVQFTGQLKGKSRKQDGKELRYVPFNIPTLVPAELVVKGLKWLGENQKRCNKSDDPKLVNSRWNKVLSERIKEHWLIVTDEEFQQIDEKDKMTYHKLRGIYFICALNNISGKKTFTKMKELAETILGDKDITAIEPYERFEVAEGAVTRI